jgi:hypothetical protein
VGIGDVEMRINAKGHGEKPGPILAIAIEEIAVIKIAVGAGKRDRFRRLMDRIIIPAC